MSISPWMVLVIGFALGSIPFGVLMGKLRGVDIQATGSGNIGATNAIRSMGKGPGIIVFILDALKGAVPVLIAKAAHTEPSWFVYAGLVAIVGHIFSPWVRFKGGKGAATGLGVLFGLDLPLALGIAGHAGSGPQTRHQADGQNGQRHQHLDQREAPSLHA